MVSEAYLKYEIHSRMVRARQTRNNPLLHARNDLDIYHFKNFATRNSTRASCSFIEPNINFMPTVRSRTSFFLERVKSHVFGVSYDRNDE